jgi:uncharacterized membrane protein YeaQ/YmgE (transglycosylase-associated protein family)
MNAWFWFLATGVIAGWLAGVVTKGRGFGLFGDLIVGVVGSVLGGWIFGVLGLSAYGLVGSIVMALIGAVALLSLIRIVKRV